MHARASADERPAAKPTPERSTGRPAAMMRTGGHAVAADTAAEPTPSGDADAAQAGRVRVGAPCDPLSDSLYRAVQQRASAARLQRAIGFEYEVNRETYAANAALTMAQRASGAAGAPAGSTPLAKGSTLVGGMGALHAKTDEGGAWAGSNLEFEITHQPETAAGRATLVKALETLERFCTLLESERTAGRRHMSAAKFRAALGGTTPGTHRCIHAAGGATTGGPQATVGIRADRLEEFMERAVGGPNAGANAVGADANRDRLDLSALRTDHFRVVGNAAGHVRAGAAAYVAAGAPAGLPAGFPSATLVGICAFMLTYIRLGAGLASSYLKGIPPLLARTDFGAIVARDLPAADRGFLGCR